MTSRWREENYFRYGRAHFALDALDTYAVTPEDPGPHGPQPGEEEPPPPPSRPRRRTSPPPRPPARQSSPPCAAPPPAPPPSSPTRCSPGSTPRSTAARRKLEAAQAAARAIPAKIPLVRAQPGHGPAGHRDQADHPRHPDGRLQRRDHPGPRPERPLRPRRRRSVRPDPRSPHRQRRHHPRRQHPAPSAWTRYPHPAAPAPWPPSATSSTPPATRYPGTKLTLRYEVKEHPGTT